MVMLQYLKKRIGQIVKADQTEEFWLQAPATAPSYQTVDLRRSLTDAASSDDLPAASTWRPEKAYSHGFDRIYSLEAVDASSIRPMNGGPKPLPEVAVAEEPPKPVVVLAKPEKKVATPAPKTVENFGGSWEQLLLPLGEEYQDWIEPFRIHEPIQVLGLSNMAEKGLLDNRKTRLRDLMGLQKQDFVFFKGLGQGHIDEIIFGLERYLGKAATGRSRKVDFGGLIRCLLGGEEKKKAYLVAEPYGLHPLFDLPPQDAAEIRHLTPEARRDLVETVSVEMGSEAKRRLVMEGLDRVVKVFVKPWMRGRYGVATRDELQERLERISDDPKVARHALRLLSQIFFDGKCFFSRFLPEIAPGVFAADSWVCKQAKLILDRGRGYFYHGSVRYPLDTLLAYLAKEFARQWVGFPDGFLENVLRSSPRFRVRKGTGGFLEIRLA